MTKKRLKLELEACDILIKKLSKENAEMWFKLMFYETMYGKMPSNLYKPKGKGFVESLMKDSGGFNEMLSESEKKIRRLKDELSAARLDHAIKKEKYVRGLSIEQRRTSDTDSLV